MPQTGTDKQGRKVRWDEEKGSWVPVETGKDKTGNPVWFDGEKWNPLSAPAQVAAPEPPPQGKVYDKPYMIGKAGMTPEYAQRLKDKAGLGQQALGGMVNSLTLGGLKKIAPEAIPDPQNDEEKLMRGAADFAGFLGTPVKLAGAGIKAIGKGVAKVAPGLVSKARTSAPLARAAGRIVKGGAELGGATALSDILDPEAQGLVEKFKQGGATGSLFATMAMVNPKSRILGQAIKQVGGRVLGQALGSYDVNDPDLTNKVFNEILYTYFLTKGYNKKQIENGRKLAEIEIKKINEEGKKQPGWKDLVVEPLAMGPEVPGGFGRILPPTPAEPHVRGPEVPWKESVAPTPKNPVAKIKVTPPQPTEAPKPITAEAPKTEPKPLSITSEQMKMGLEEYDKQWLKDNEGIGIIEKGDYWLKKLNKYLVESGTISATPDKTVAYQLKEVERGVKESATTQDKFNERRFLYGATVEKNLARMGEAGPAVASAANEYARTKRSETLKDNANIVKANVAARSVYPNTVGSAKEIDSATHKRIAEIIEGRAKPTSVQEINLVKAYDAPLKKVRDRVAALQAKGVKVTIDGPYGPREWSPVDGYYPRVYENLTELLSSELPQGKHAREILASRMAKREFADLYKDPLTRQDALDKAMRVIDIRRNQMRKGRYGHLEKTRLWETEDLAELEAKGLVKRTYGTAVLSDYFAKTNDRLAWLEQFGHDVHQYVPGGTQTIPKLLADKLPEIKDADNRQYIANFFRDYLNRGQMTSRTRLTYDLLGKFQNLKLWMAGIPNASQWFVNTLPKTPMRDVPKVLYETIRSYGGEKAGVEFLNEAGVMDISRDINKALMDSPEKLRAFNDLFFKITGFKATETWNAKFAAFAGKATAERFAKKLSKRPGSFRAEFWESELKRMGVEQGTIDTIKKGGTSEVSLKELARSAWAMKKWTQFVSDEFFLPAIFSKEGLAPALKFKNYPYNQSINWYGGEIIRPSVEFAESLFKHGRRGREGDMTPMFKAIVTIPLAGYAVAQVKKKVYGLLGINLYKDIIDNGPWWEKMGLYILNAGNLGIVTDLLLASSGHELLTSIFGPSASDFVSLADGITKSAQEFEKVFAANNPQFIKDRQKAIGSYWLKVSERLLPESKPFINMMFKEYSDIKDAKKWKASAAMNRERYKLAYIYNSPEVAEQVWEAFVTTQGEEYYKMFGSLPTKPTTQEIVQYAQELQEMPGSEMLR